MSGEIVPADDLPGNEVPADDLPSAAPQKKPQSMLERFAPIGAAFLKGLAPGIPSFAAATGEAAIEGLDKVGTIAGDATTDALGGVVPGEVAGAAGTAVKMAPGMLAGMVGGAPAMTGGARRVMQSALKPTSKSLANGDAAKAIDTMLKEGVSVTSGGAAALRAKIAELKAEVGKLLAQSQGTVNKGWVFSELSKALDDVTKQGLPGADRKAVLEAWTQFKNHPLLQGTNDIPVQLADDLKRGTQAALKDFYRRNPGSAAPAGLEKSQAAIASGLRQGIEDATPGVAAANKKLSEYINALHQIEPRAAIAANRDLGGLVPLAPTPEAAMVMLADRNPWMKSLVARVLFEGRKAIPAGAGAVAGASTPFQAGSTTPQP